MHCIDFCNTFVASYSKRTQKAMVMQEKELTQSEILAKELLAIAPDVTRGDRKAYREETGISRTLLSNYLNGTVWDNDTGVSILTFMRKRIAARYAAIAK